MKILRAYAVTVVICLSLMSVASCVFLADESAKKVVLGSESAVLVMNSTDEKIYGQAYNLTPITEKLAELVKKAAGLAPAPISNIYWFAVNISKINNL
jgi:hypothetical protein